MESTGIYWIPIYASLEESKIGVVLANPRQVKAIPGRKIDIKDSEWLATLLRSKLVKPSYVPKANLRSLRSLTRLRAVLVQNQAGYKNKVHKILQLSNVRLDSEITDIFGKSGRILIEAISKGESIDKALERCPASVRKNGEAIKSSVMGVLSQADLFALRLCLGVEEFDVKIGEVDSQIVKYVDEAVVEVLCSVPGVGCFCGGGGCWSLGILSVLWMRRRCVVIVVLFRLFGRVGRSVGAATSLSMVIGGLGGFWFSVLWRLLRFRIVGLGSFICGLRLVGGMGLRLLLWLERCWGLCIICLLAARGFLRRG
jgi:hypothetical protein